MTEVHEDDEPTTIQEAQAGDDWKNWKVAIEEELHSHEMNGT